LAYRSAWKAEYKTLSAEIRALRLADRFHQRSQFARLPLSAAEQRCLAAATTICEAAKLEAQRQYLARKAGEAPSSSPRT
jgi:hypothetical protein